jgi:molybdopterin-guanine dinucleotide biosynthesis protein A
MKGVVLAGGLASRFDGRPKGLEKVGGERILDRVVQVVRTATEAAPILIANAEDAATWRDDLEIVQDIETGFGSLGGIHTALNTVDGPVLVVAWDMPFVPVELLQALIRGWKSYDAYLPDSTGPLGMEPLCAVYGPVCKDPVRQALDAEDYRTTAFHDKIRVGRLPLNEVEAFGSPDSMFFNVNVQEDVERADELWRDQHQVTS